MSLFFFFSSRRRHTRYIGDWSSDVCSSDLRVAVVSVGADNRYRLPSPEVEARYRARGTCEIGRASCREREELMVGVASITRGGIVCGERVARTSTNSHAHISLYVVAASDTR